MIDEIEKLLGSRLQKAVRSKRPSAKIAPLWMDQNSFRSKRPFVKVAHCQKSKRPMVKWPLTKTVLHKKSKWPSCTASLIYFRILHAVQYRSVWMADGNFRPKTLWHQDSSALMPK